MEYIHYPSVSVWSREQYESYRVIPHLLLRFFFFFFDSHIVFYADGSSKPCHVVLRSLFFSVLNFFFCKKSKFQVSFECGLHLELLGKEVEFALIYLCKSPLLKRAEFERAHSKTHNI